MGKLTDVSCRGAKCQGQKVRKLGDGEGLYLWVFDTGRKLFHFRYKFKSVQKGLHIGEYPDTSLSDARREARKMADLVKSGIDPSAVRRSVGEHIPDVPTWGLMATEWFEKNKGEWTEKHRQDVWRRLSVNTFPDLEHRPMHEIDGPELLKVIEKMEDRGATELSHRVNGNCSQVFRYAIAKGVCKFDVAASIVGALKAHVEKNHASVNRRELPELMQKVNGYHTIGEEETEIGLNLLAHTFTRTTELIGAKKAEFFLEEDIWEIPPERMKKRRPHVVPLTKQTKAMVERLIELSGKSEYLFPCVKDPKNHMSNNTMLFALYALGYKGKMTGHGFRSVASTILNEEGWNRDWVEKQLAHEEDDKVRGAYNKAEYLKGRRAMMEWWSRYLDAVQHGRKPPKSPYAADV